MNLSFLTASVPESPPTLMVSSPVSITKHCLGVKVLGSPPPWNTQIIQINLIQIKNLLVLTRVSSHQRWGWLLISDLMRTEPAFGSSVTFRLESPLAAVRSWAPCKHKEKKIYPQTWLWNEKPSNERKRHQRSSTSRQQQRCTVTSTRCRFKPGK